MALNFPPPRIILLEGDPIIGDETPSWLRPKELTTDMSTFNPFKDSLSRIRDVLDNGVLNTRISGGFRVNGGDPFGVTTISAKPVDLGLPWYVGPVPEEIGDGP